MCSLAEAESEYKFEHRDLHWGNILISKTTRKTRKFKVGGKFISVPMNGVSATIIDFTLSRMSLKSGQIIYYAIGSDPDMFIGIGDYQFEIYRMMKRELE